MNANFPLILPVILSGGTGTRLWPLSRESYPKQFWPLASDQTMLAETAARGTGAGFLPPMVVCNEAHRFLVAEQLRDKGASIVLEPVGRNSAPAIAAASLLAEENAPGSVLWFMAADAAIGDVAALQAALAQAASAAKAGAIVTFGMQPTAPETGYGYIEAGDDLPGSDGVKRIARFVEKPDAARAAEFLKSGRHLWNSGMFVATAATMLAELEAHAPEVLKGVRAAVAGAKRDGDFIRLEASAFTATPA
ncbi:MAG: mannose-1-phosphate guanylyltransferase, partial [Alphaproteobacteria bacterium]